MNIPSSRIFFLSVLLSLLAIPIRAEEEPAKKPDGFRPFPNNQPLVIVNGSIQNAQHTPASVQNLIELVRLAYPDSNITLIGVNDMVIENLTFQWQSHRNPVVGDIGRVNPPLDGVLETLSVASGRKFRVSARGPKDFLLSPWDDSPPTHCLTEVFNLGTLTKQTRQKAALEEDLQRATTELVVLKNRYGEKHPRVVEITDFLDIQKARIAQITASMPDTNKLLEQIQEVVKITLELKSIKEQPEFKYHPGTNLLIVIGSVEAIETTRKVIAALEKTP